CSRTSLAAEVLNSSVNDRRAMGDSSCTDIMPASRSAHYPWRRSHLQRPTPSTPAGSKGGNARALAPRPVIPAADAVVIRAVFIDLLMRWRAGAAAARGREDEVRQYPNPDRHYTVGIACNRSQSPRRPGVALPERDTRIHPGASPLNTLRS